MATHRWPRVLSGAGARLLVAALAATLLAGCGDDGPPDAATTVPRTVTSTTAATTTTTEPGPNEPPVGLETVRGTVHLGEEPCVGLVLADGARLQLRLVGYSRPTGTAELIDDATGAVVARDGDTMIVAGFRRNVDEVCGRVFDVDSIVNVEPA